MNCEHICEPQNPIRSAVLATARVTSEPIALPFVVCIRIKALARHCQTETAPQGKSNGCNRSEISSGCYANHFQLLILSLSAERPHLISLGIPAWSQLWRSQPSHDQYYSSKLIVTWTSGHSGPSDYTDGNVSQAYDCCRPLDLDIRLD